jgi:hypothetical protein
MKKTSRSVSILILAQACASAASAQTRIDAAASRPMSPVFASAVSAPALTTAFLASPSILSAAALTAPAPLAAPSLPSAQSAAAAIPAAAAVAPAAAPAAASRAEALAAPALAGLRAEQDGIDRPAQPGEAASAPALQARFNASFDGAVPPSGEYRAPTWNDQTKIDEAARRAVTLSPTAAALQNEFARNGGRTSIDERYRADYQGAAFGHQYAPGVVLTRDVIDNAPWEFIQSIAARAQVENNSWYADVPASAEKLTAAVVNSLLVFGELTNSTSHAQSWATDKDHKSLDGSYVMWTWYEQLLNYARSTAHLNDSKLFAWVRDSLSKMVSGNSAYQYSLWEMLKGTYYRPGSALNGQQLPAGAPRIDQATYDRAAQKIYGSDGRGTRAPNAQGNVMEWALGWLKKRGEF